MRAVFVVWTKSPRLSWRSALSPWLVPLILWASVAPITTGTPRFRAAIDPFVILLAAFAIQAIVTRLRSVGGSRALPR